MASTRQEIDWKHLDKKKFFGYGIGVFSSITIMLYPLSVIKTRLMVQNTQIHASVSSPTKVPGPIAQTRNITAEIYNNEGIRGFYRGMGTVLAGSIPSRIIYLGTLEFIKEHVLSNYMQKTPLKTTTVPPPPSTTTSSTPTSITATTDSTDETETYLDDPSQSLYPMPSTSHIRQTSVAGAGLANFIAGAVASLVTQSCLIPIDVISQRQMIEKDAIKSNLSNQFKGISAVEMTRRILREEGIRGLYRGFAASIASFVPSSALWWGSYGAYQRLGWILVDSSSSTYPQETDKTHRRTNHPRKAIAIEVTAGIFAGCTTACLTNPLDVIKTRVQVSGAKHVEFNSNPKFTSSTSSTSSNSSTPGTKNARAVIVQIFKQDGFRGFYRGIVPRMTSTSLWGTCMVSAYEFLKRVSAN